MDLHVASTARTKERAIAGMTTGLIGVGETVTFEAQHERYIAKRLDFDQRGTPVHRRRLKAQKRESQRGLCPSYKEALPEHGAELHWARATRRYMVENTSLVCARCHAGA